MGKASPRRIAEIELPEDTLAILWDLDGVIIDSLQFDLEVIPQLFQKYSGKTFRFTRELLQSFFGNEPVSFLGLLNIAQGDETNALLDPSELDALCKEYLASRADATSQLRYNLLPGVTRALDDARSLELPSAVVSNNPTQHVRNVIDSLRIGDYFSAIIGNDLQREGLSLKKKPAPDFYLLAAETLDIIPSRCIAFEDTEIGARSAKAAGCHVIALLTGGGTLESLERFVMSSRSDLYSSFLGPKLLPKS